MRHDPPVKPPRLKSNLSNHLTESDSQCKQKVNNIRLKKVYKNLYSEEALQIALASYLDNLEFATKSFKWFHVPNGGKRGILTAKKLKAQGVKRGIPDICIILAAGKIIFIELKAEGGVLSPEQKQFSADVSDLGHRVYVVNGAHPVDVNQQVGSIMRDHGVYS